MDRDVSRAYEIPLGQGERKDHYPHLIECSSPASREQADDPRRLQRRGARPWRQQLHFVARVSADCLRKAVLQQNTVSILEELALSEFVIPCLAVNGRIDPHRQHGERLVFEPQLGEPLDAGDSGFDAGEPFHSGHDRLRKIAAAFGRDLKRSPAGDRLKHLLRCLPGGGGAQRNGDYRGHADGDAQERQQGPAWATAQFPSGELPEYHCRGSSTVTRSPAAPTGTCPLSLSTRPSRR